MKGCWNNYGIWGSKKNLACLEATGLFFDCVDNHQRMAMFKKYWPEKFACNQMSYANPTKEEIFD